MFKIKNGTSNMVNKTFRLPSELIEIMMKIAQNKNISLNNLVRQCCEYAINHLDNEDS